MKTFSIAELERYSLIKAHTFRTWETRFDIFKSQRKTTNIRYYTIEELSFLLDFTLLNRFGYKVSALACLTKDEIKDKVYQLNDAAKQEHQIHRLIICMFALDIEDFEFTLDSAISGWGIDATIEKVIIPFLDRLQLFSYKHHTSSEYHLVVTALRKKIILGIENTRPRSLLCKSAVLFLPKGEHYDLLLLYINYKLRKAGLNVLYLGTNISDGNLKSVIQLKQPHYLVTYHPTSWNQPEESLQNYLTETTAEALFIVGTTPYSRPIALSDKIRYVSFKEMDNELSVMI